MRNPRPFCKSIVAALLFAASAALAQEEPAPEPPGIADLLAELADPDTTNWRQVENKIRLEWSKSGSPAMDLLLQRAKKSMDEEDWDTALDHLTALTDHAPDFAEGWHARATVFFQKGLYGPAIDDLGRALTLNPDHFSALSGLAVILEEVDMGPEALETLRALSRIHPHNPDTKAALDRLEKAYGGVPL